MLKAWLEKFPAKGQGTRDVLGVSLGYGVVPPHGVLQFDLVSSDFLLDRFLGDWKNGRRAWEKGPFQYELLAHAPDFLAVVFLSFPLYLYFSDTLPVDERNSLEQLVHALEQAVLVPLAFALKVLSDQAGQPVGQFNKRDVRVVHHVVLLNMAVVTRVALGHNIVQVRDGRRKVA